MQSKTVQEKEYYKSSEIAKMFGVCTRTVKRWRDRGDLKFVRTPAGHYYVTREAMKDFLKEYHKGAETEEKVEGAE